MNGLLKYIIKNLIYIFMFIFLFLFLFTSTIMLAQSPTVKEISNFNKIRDQQKQICLKLKNNGFNDSSISVDNKILAKYYNAILDKILESNQDILSKYNKKASEFCILLVDETSEVRGFQSLGEGLIQVGIGPKFLLA